MTARASVAIEVVGRLIEQDEVGFVEDKGGEADPRALPARQRRQRRVRRGVQPEAVEGRRDACLQDPVGAASASASASPRSARRSRASAWVAPNRSATVSPGSTCTDWRSTPTVPVTDTSPDCGASIAGDQLEQRGLARAVASDEAGAFVAEVEIEIGKDGPAVRRRPGEMRDRD